VKKINKKRFLLSFVIAIVFLFGNTITPDVLHVLGIKNTHTIVQAGFKSGGFKSSSKSSSGGFKSGSFSSSTSKSSSGGFKSGGFFNSKSKSSSESSGNSYNTTTKKSFIPIPIPWSSRSYGHSFLGGPVGFIGGMVSGFFKLIIFIIIIIVIINIIKKSKRRY